MEGVQNSVQVCATLQQTLPQSFEINAPVTFIEGTAGIWHITFIANSIMMTIHLDEHDFVQITTSLFFTSATPTDCIEFLIVGDSNFIEPVENFTISASIGPFNASARILILNDGE